MEIKVDYSELQAMIDQLKSKITDLELENYKLKNKEKLETEAMIDDMAKYYETQANNAA